MKKKNTVRVYRCTRKIDSEIEARNDLKTSIGSTRLTSEGIRENQCTGLPRKKRPVECVPGIEVK